MYLLPNYCKKVGLTLFIPTATVNLINGFIHGYNNGSDSTKIPELVPFDVMGITIFSDSFFEITALISAIGLLIYALSKDEKTDEFIIRLRMEAVHLTFFISLLTIAFLLLFNVKTNLDALYIIELQIIIFLIAKKSKKISASPSTSEGYEQ
ncbi:hypothetical protein [Fodinibius halophilus]|uniref:Uncharacterized protein n=1 Tax=Fodinibius halophilus TaxID=1736908 RepID=A0A6M1SUJ1_9BACT|nr:hypothetical protein [Fodinibius halophilus]NGP87226.1 hypothetical protein [Fodinibius halophilus]